MKKNIVSFLYFMLCLLTLFTCSKTKEETYNLVGTVGRAYATISITVNDDGTVIGSYYYDKYKEDIALNGSLVKKGLILEEKVDDEITGEFVGTFNKEKMEYQGDWRNPKTEKLTAFAFAQKRDSAIIENTRAVRKTNDTKNESYLKRLEGSYGDDDISIRLIYINPRKIYIAADGWRNSYIGGFSFILDYVNGQLIYTGKQEDDYGYNIDDDYVPDEYGLLVYVLDDNKIGIEESNAWGMHGVKFGDFTGEYEKINKK